MKFNLVQSIQTAAMNTQNKNPIYFDYNATAPVLPEVANAVLKCLSSFGNPSSIHRRGREARALVETARDSVAELIGANARDVVFTSGGTEANGLALQGLLDSGRCKSIMASAVEHPSVLAHVAVDQRIPVDANGQIKLDALEEALQRCSSPVLISTMYANNETGVVQPISAVVDLARKYDALTHCDAVQAPGKAQLDVSDLGVDLVTLSAHKFGGMKGVGALILNNNLPISAEILGGGQERGRRAGTENVLGIVGFGIAAKFYADARNEIERVKNLRDRLESEIRQKFPEAIIVGSDVERLCNTSCVLVPGIPSEHQLMKLDLENIAVSAGSACSSGKVAPSHVLLAMNISNEDAKCAIRVSLGRNNTDADVDRFLNVWSQAAGNKSVH